MQQALDVVYVLPVTSLSKVALIFRNTSCIVYVSIVCHGASFVSIKNHVGCSQAGRLLVANLITDARFPPGPSNSFINIT